MIIWRSVWLFIRDFILVVITIPILLILILLAYSGVSHMYSWRHTLTFKNNEKTLIISKKDRQRYILIKAEYKDMPKCSLEVLLDGKHPKFINMRDEGANQGIINLNHKDPFLKLYMRGDKFQFWPQKLEGESEVTLKCNCPTKDDWNGKVKFQITYTNDPDPWIFGRLLENFGI